MRRVFITFLICLTICVLSSVGIGLYRHARNLEEFGNIHMYVSLGMAVLGGFFLKGAGVSGDPYAEMVVDNMSHDPEAYRHAREQDRARGIGFGWIVFSAGIVSAAVCYLLIM